MDEKSCSIGATTFLRPKFHFSTPVGWCNDPNGFSVFNNKIHLFFQHYPDDIKWGPMHWGHAVTEDLLTWTFLPIALAPQVLGADEKGFHNGNNSVYITGKLDYESC